jgi:hypothetical protein
MDASQRHPDLHLAATIEFTGAKEGTQLVISEQGIFLDDFDDARGATVARRH